MECANLHRDAQRSGPAGVPAEPDERLPWREAIEVIVGLSLLGWGVVGGAAALVLG
jgi:hypothetical protein